ncbi:MAG: TOBE domain-containing protein [Gammaproteobacteria bacterium]|nr:TOBE domain-containing protein [Gammaproteobacteria bacterium]
MSTSNRPEIREWSGHLLLENRFGQRVSDTRIRLLEAIAETGSISQAAKAVPMAYKSAWEAVDILNNLAPQPVIATTTGGKRGGGANLTPYGHSLIALYRAIDAEYQRSVHHLAELLPGIDPPNEERMRLLLRSMNGQYSARNQLLGRVIGLRADEVDYEVCIRLDSGEEVTAIITGESAERLRVAIGRPLLALIKSSSVVLTNSRQLRSSARNQFWGEVTQLHQGAIHVEVMVTLASGKTLTAVITKESARFLDLEPGACVGALFQASNVVLVSFD